MVNEIGTAGGVGGESAGSVLMKMQISLAARSFVFAEPRRTVTSRTLGGTNGAAYGRRNSVSSTYRYMTAIAVRFWLVVLLYALTSSYW